MLCEVPTCRRELIDRVVEPVLVRELICRAHVAVVGVFTLTLRTEGITTGLVGVATYGWE